VTTSSIFGDFVYIMSDSLVFFNNSILENSIAKDGGAIYLLGYSNLTIVNTNFTNNYATDQGGAIYATSFN